MAEDVSRPAALASTSSSSSSSPIPDDAPAGKHVYKGWAQFQRAINRELPDLLSRADQVNAATRRVLGGG